MKKEQLVIVALILAVGLGVALLGRTGPRGPETGLTRSKAILEARKIPIMAVVGRREADGYLKELKAGLKSLPQAKQVKLVVIDPGNPNERETLKTMSVGKPPTLLVIGLDGQGLYGKAGAYDMAKVTQAIDEGLKRKPIEFPKPGEEHEHSHSHSD